ncbi:MULTISPECIES: diguanylate cyclase domain-containing protein [Coprococcus]|jgi:diguanylate cyclase (GGDEF)-like protein|uniref:diguanylate cyclase domain-containing protein n=1 Tax=Coprococcus TaxID=33042 RepID=UPI000E764EBF|nr:MULTISPECIES: diguanylate cyclase [Coprococcus]RJW76627.1 diguanylate cyclase [Coprococcus sp. AF38-1]
MNSRKNHNKKLMLPVLIFLVGCLVLTVVLYHSYRSNYKQVRNVTALNATTYAERLQNDMNRGVAITDTLEEIAISENGKIDNFQKVARDLMADFIQSIQIAPDGVVTDIYPEAGNEAGKIDLMHDESRGEICRYGRDKNIVTMQGPFDLKQGGQGIAIRNPVYLEGADGSPVFWGFTIVIIRVPEIFTESIQALTKFGYDYSLTKTVSPLSDDTEIVSSSGNIMKNPITFEFEFGGCLFDFEVMPADGWSHGWNVFPQLFLGICVILLLTGLTVVILVIERHRDILKKIAITDPLTGLLNRKGFDEQLKKVMQGDLHIHCVGIQMDIDDFKFINDMYGHVVGDAALKSLAQDMQSYFNDNSILCRNGGDEFSVILVDTTEEEARKKIEHFTLQPRHITYNGEEHPFYISLGYAEYPKDCEDVLKLIRCADMALYAVKLHGKHNCSRYRGDYKIQHRRQLGFALQDVSKNLPGAFLIYIADPENDDILFANRELIELAGCRDFDDFLDYTDRRFRNLIHPDERDSVETSIWEQIDAKTNGNNDYVRFHFAKKDGSYLPVLDHGRIVENRYYGNVFYVLIMDCALVESYYDNKTGLGTVQE